MSESELKNISEKVLDSKLFRKSKTYQNLLRYLLEKNLTEEAPKETSIAIDVFNKGLDFNPSEDTTVRVHVHKLRKKLDEYYHNEGKDDQIRITIPKGHYEIHFKQVDHDTQQDKGTRIKFYALFIALVFFICSTLFLLITDFRFNSRELIKQDDPLWANFFNNKYPISIVIGDFLVFHETDKLTGRRRRIQDYSINTEDELEAFKNKYPEKEIDEWVLGELPHNSLYNAIDLQPVFLSFGKKFEFAFTLKLDLNYIANRNIIYIGEFKNLRILENLTASFPFEIETLPWWMGEITIDEDSTYTLKTFQQWDKNQFTKDLGMIAKLRGPKGENYIICAGFGYNSQIRMVKLLSTPDGLAQIEKSILDENKNVPKYFVSIFEVSGFAQGSTSAELKYYSILPENYLEKAFSAQ